MESYMDVLKDRADQEECYAWAVYEIERLRELFELERKDNIDVRHHLAKANDQIERLRHEMERIADVSEQRWPNSLVSQIYKIARAALKEGK